MGKTKDKIKGNKRKKRVKSSIDGDDMEKRRDLFHGRRQKSVENSVKFEKEGESPQLL